MIPDPRHVQMSHVTGFALFCNTQTWECDVLQTSAVQHYKIWYQSDTKKIILVLLILLTYKGTGE